MNVNLSHFCKFLKVIVIAFDKNELMQLDTDTKRGLAFETLDSIDEELVNTPLTNWKQKLIEDRLIDDKNNPEDATLWSEVRKKYLRQ